LDCLTVNIDVNIHACPMVHCSVTARYGVPRRIHIISLVVLSVNINMTPLENDALLSAKFVGHYETSITLGKST